jgi:tetratricopeptide (TPR) repeat protein
MKLPPRVKKGRPTGWRVDASQRYWIQGKINDWTKRRGNNREEFYAQALARLKTLKLAAKTQYPPPEDVSSFKSTFLDALRGNRHLPDGYVHAIADVLGYSLSSFRRNLEGARKLEADLPVTSSPINQGSWSFSVLESVIHGLLMQLRERPFEGREDHLSQLDRFLTSPKGFLLLRGRAGFGKSALLAHWLGRPKRGKTLIRYFFNHRFTETRSAPEFLRYFLVKLFKHLAKPLPHPMPQREQEFRETIVSTFTNTEDVSKLGKYPLLLVLDGLDEAADTFSPPFPLVLPVGLHVVVSARCGSGECPGFLKPWIEYQPSELAVDTLSRVGIVSWIRKQKILAGLAKDASFLDDLEQRTENCPLYLHHLFEELCRAIPNGETARTVLDRTPKGFTQYVRQQYEDLAQNTADHCFSQQILCLIAAAEGELDEADLTSLSGLGMSELRNLPWQLERWIARLPARGGRGDTFGFSHGLLKRELRDCLPIHTAVSKLVAYCGRWQDHKSPYALQHFTAHLIAERNWSGLEELVLNQDFIEAQQEAFPHEPSLSFRTLQTALFHAAENDNSKAITKLMLTHAALVSELAMGEKLAASSEVKSLSHWRDVADVCANIDENAALMLKFLIGWRCCVNKEYGDASKVFSELAEGEKVSMDGSWQTIAVAVITHLSRLEDDLLLKLINRFLSPRYQGRLIRALTKAADRRSFALSERVLDGITEPSDAFEARRELLDGMATARLWDLAIVNTELAGDAAKQARLLADLALVATNQSAPAQIENVLERIRTLGAHTSRDLYLRRIAASEVRAMALLGVAMLAKDNPDGTACLEQAQKLAESLELGTVARVLAFSDLLMAYARVHREAEARQSIADALFSASRLQPNNDEQVPLLLQVAQTLVEATAVLPQMRPDAEQLLRRIEMSRVEPLRVGWIRRQLSICWGELGDFSEAKRVAQITNDRHEQGKAVYHLITLLFEAGRLSEAMELAHMRVRWPAWSWAAIGMCQLKQGRIDAASSAFFRSIRLGSTRSESASSSQLVQTFADISWAARQAGNLELASRFAYLALQRAEKIQAPPEWRCRVMLNVVEGTSGVPDCDVATRAMNEALLIAWNYRPGFRKVELLCAVAVALHKINRQQESHAVFDQVETVADQVYGLPERTRAFGEIAEALTTCQITSEADRLLNRITRMAKKGANPRSEQRIAWGELSLAYAKCGRIPEAFEVAQRLGNHAAQAARRALAIVYASRGDLSKALIETEHVKNPHGKAKALRDVAIALERAGLPNEALRAASQIEKYRDDMLHRVAEVFVECNDRVGFKCLLIPNAWFFNSTFVMIGLVARLYQSEVNQIASAMEHFGFAEVQDEAPHQEPDSQ